jgi:phenylalanyl-tRNA synthetase beta chain
MNISYRWLQELVPELADPAERVASRLAMYGAPVEELVRLGEFLSEIVIARVAAVRPHPNADRLSLCTVDAGAGEPLQVVCGAPNVRAGAFYPFAPVGAMLPGDLVIRKAKIRGEESRGMLCSERELGLGRDHAGLMELHGRWHPGEPFLDALGLDDVRLVVEVTANRPDLLSHIGIARELAPGGRLELPALPGAAQEASREPSFAVERLTGETGGVTVTIEDAGGCPRYLGAVIRGVTIGSSPAWLAARLRAVGLRPINNVVDATNYILYELGQPLHAFDLRWLGGPAVRIRRARSNEELVTLDGISRSLSPDMLVIADEQRAVAVAGVMGGEDSEVRADTTDIFLECALFEPKTVRRTRTALGLSTDASYRFERGVDPEGGSRVARWTSPCWIFSRMPMSRP